MKLLSIGNYGLHTLQYPSGRWGYVGSVPLVLCSEKDGKFGKEYPSKTFITEQEAVDFFESNKHLL